MSWRVEITCREGIFDSFADSILKDILDLRIHSVKNVDVAHIFKLEGKFSQSQVEIIAARLLTNPITQQYKILPERESFFDKLSVEIAHNPGVMDPVEESTIKGIQDLGFPQVTGVSATKRFTFDGELTPKELNTVVERVLANKLIQHVVTEASERAFEQKTKPAGGIQLIVVDLIDANEKRLMEISQKGQLYLNINEMKTIQAHFKKLGRNPTDCELETIAQTWSEHCYHKTFRGNIRYTHVEKGKKKTKLIKSLLKSTIVKATNEINKNFCVSVFHDNAGVVKFDKDDHVCFKVETHNHPSALEPFGGANTGLGGVIRDILGTGLGAKPICSTDVFCFAPPDMAYEDLPPGTLHPKRVMKGVVSGVRDYGNKMGIPTVNGAIAFDKHFVGNPLVYCGTVGLIPKDCVKKKVSKGDLIVVAGGRTGRDGIHGATFSSGELTTESEVVSSGAVQIGNPIEEKKVLDALLKARDQKLYSAITDCGAGGLSSAVGEMGKDTGARVQLEKVPLKYAGLSYMEVWISESQERMVMSVPPKNIDKLLKIFRDENAEATVIGEFSGTGRLEMFYENCQVSDLDMAFLHDGIPNITKEARWEAPRLTAAKLPANASVDLAKSLYKVLGHFNVCSKEWVIRQYDHEVQGGSVIKPLSGKYCDGPSDASVVLPKPESKKGIAVSNGINFRFGMIDPYWMAASVIDEAVRQIVVTGGNMEKIAILDNFCWGNPDKPDRLGSLVRAAEGCYKFATAYKVPFISGKDSLYNEYTEGNKSIAIPGTLLISALGIVDDVTKCVSMDLKAPGNSIYCLGDTQDELGGSIYWATMDQLGVDVPKLNSARALKMYQAFQEACQSSLVESAHDCSEGGFAVALSEMAFAGGLGVSVDLKKLYSSAKSKTDVMLLFSESNARIIVEVKAKNKNAFEKAMKGSVCRAIGEVYDNNKLAVCGLKGNVCIEESIEDLKTAWQKPLAW